MKILSVASDFSFLLHSERIEWWVRDTLLKEKGHTLFLLAPYSEKNALLYPDKFKAFKEKCLSLYDKVWLFPLNSVHGNPLNALRAIFSPRPYVVNQRRINSSEKHKIDQEIQSLLPSLNAIIVEISFAHEILTPWLQEIKRFGIPLVMRMENIETHFFFYHWRRRNLFDKLIRSELWVLFLDIVRMAFYEKKILPFYDHILCVSSLEMAIIKEKWKIPQVTFLPYWYQVPSSGFFLSEEEKKIVEELEYKYKQKKVIFIVNNFSEKYNLKEIKWFIFKVFPLIKRQIPHVTLLFGGYNASRYFQNISLPENVELLSSIPSVKPFMQKADLIPIVTNAPVGVKIKLVEALYYKKKVVCLPQSIQGCGLEELLPTASQPSEFARLCIQALKGEKDKEYLSLFDNFSFLYDHYRNIEILESLINTSLKTR